jgi:hypothetical protein
VWSERYRSLLGYDSTSVTPSLQTWLERVPKEERPRLLQQFESAVASGSAFQAEHQVVLDNEQRWIALFGKLHGGHRMIGVAMGVFSSQAAEQGGARLERARNAR